MHEKFHVSNNVGYVLFIFGMFVTRGFPLFKLNKLPFLKIRGGIKDNSSKSDFKSVSSKSSLSSSISPENNVYHASKSFTSEQLLKAHQESLDLYHRFRSTKDHYIASQLNSALDILTDALRLYGPNQLFSSYNGGKDAVVIMHLLRAVTAKYSADKGEIYQPQFVYFAIKDEFPEVVEHIKESEEQFCLALTRYNCSISQGLVEHIKKSTCSPGFILGTRQSDPNCGTFINPF